MTIRTRLLDDTFTAAAGDGLRQVVILAAGMDTRALRLDWPEGTKVFEVERLEVLAYKDRVLASIGARPKATRRSVAIDLRAASPFRAVRADRLSGRRTPGLSGG